MQVSFLALTFQCFFSLVICAVDGGPHCTELKESTIDNFLADPQSPSLVIYHSETCSVCVQTMPKFIAAAEEAKKQSIAARFAHVNCGSEKPVCTRFNVTRYPSILYFEPGSVAEQWRKYNNPRLEESFVGYTKRMTLKPRIQRISGTQELQREIVNEEYAGLIMVESTKLNMDSLPDPLATAVETWRDKHRFFFTTDLGEFLPDTKGASMIAYSPSTRQWPAAWGAKEDNGDHGFDVFHGDLTGKDNISHWISHHRFPGVANLTLQNLWEFTHSEKKAVVVAVNPSHDNKEVDVAVRRALRKFSDQFYFGVIDGVSVADAMERFNIYSSELPRVLVGEDNLEYWIEDDENLTVGNLESDLEALLNGAPLLRQGPFLTIPLYYARKVKRLAIRVKVYADQGAAEKGMLIFALFFLLILFGFLRKLIVTSRRKEEERKLEFQKRLEKVVEDRTRKAAEKRQQKEAARQQQEAQDKDGSSDKQEDGSSGKQEEEGPRKRK